MKVELELIECTRCNNPMPKLRKDLYGYDFCIKCSTVMPKVGRVVTYGQGEDIWNDLEIMNQDEAKRILELEQMNSSKNFEVLELLDYNQDALDSPESRYRNIGAAGSVISTCDYVEFPDRAEQEDDTLQEDEEDNPELEDK